MLCISDLRKRERWERTTKLVQATLRIISNSSVERVLATSEKSVVNLQKGGDHGTQGRYIDQLAVRRERGSLLYWAMEGRKN